MNGEIPVGTVQERNMASGNSYSLLSANNNKYNGCELISLTGKTVKSLQLIPSLKQPFVSPNGVAPGLYYLHFTGNGIAPVTRPVLVK